MLQHRDYDTMIGERVFYCDAAGAGGVLDFASALGPMKSHKVSKTNDVDASIG
jgi:hypothetical protein